MYLDNIAPEIRLEILQLCSPKDLASLASVHSSLRDVAERALYTHIYLSAHPFDLIQDQKRSQEGRTSNPWALKEHGSLLHTLSTSAWKAKIVKSLYIELHSTMSHHEVQNATRYILIKLSQLLKNMPNLVDFRIIYDALDDPSEGRLSEALRRGRFQLHTLWLDESHDLKGIVTNQPNLRLLGVYYGHRGDTDKHLWRQIKGLFQTVPSTRTMPTICMLNCYSPWVPMVNIFPAYHRPGEVVREFQEIVRSLFEFPKRYLRRRGCNITFDLFGIKKENINLLGDVMEGIATCIRSFSPSWSTTFLEFTIDDTMIKVHSRLSSFTQLVYSNRSHGTSPGPLEPYHSLNMWRILLSIFVA
ncbi:hypothetical protein F5887DRAFT_976970 [Amanita rubescens]|nr:hypothetical protein F5887DRAFT_976970 [Amanita rubescens]